MQSELNLGVKASRPDFNNRKIWDPKHPKIEKLIKEYITWSNEGEDLTTDDYDLYVEDIINCFDEVETDGYYLATFLKDKSYINPDTNLVNMLDEIYSIKRAITNEITKKWVIDNDMKLPDDIIGKKCNYKSGYKKYEGYYITTVNHSTYTVTIDKSKHKQGGIVCNFEDITIINDECI